MVNRVLIRMKVVQLLYSYLLTKSEFKINAAPVNPTRDKAFAHTVYMDLLLMLLEFGGYRTHTGAAPTVADRLPSNPRFNQSKMMRALAANDDIRAAINRHNNSRTDFDKALPTIYNAVVSSDIYKKYLRARTRGLKEDVDFWSVVIRTVIEPNEVFLTAARTNPGFTLKGLEEGVRDVVETLNDFNDEKAALTSARNALDHSLNKAYQLYHALLRLPLELSRRYDLRLDEARNKYLPTDRDLNPNTYLVDSPVVALLASNPVLAEYADEHPGEWDSDDLLLDHLLDAILASDLYARYTAGAAPTMEEDATFWRGVMKTIILPDDELAETLENKSVYWNDDLDIMGTFVLKTLKRLSESPDDPKAVLPQYKDEEDSRFGPDLFINVVEHYDEYRALVEEFIDSRQWDTERLAFMDVVVMCTAIAEMLNYPQIPIPVTLNEYIEIANYYSTPKSGKFINGVLFSVISQLQNEGKLLRK